MRDVIEEAAFMKAGTLERERALHAIRVLAQYDALDLVPMLLQPPGPEYNHDAWRRKQKRQKREGK